MNKKITWGVYAQSRRVPEAEFDTYEEAFAYADEKYVSFDISRHEQIEPENIPTIIDIDSAKLGLAPGDI